MVQPVMRLSFDLPGMPIVCELGGAPVSCVNYRLYAMLTFGIILSRGGGKEFLR